uniref:Uncharacterized protein n=1 Tax=Oryza nivara TaxID=4536 RepID=A0A0E0J2R5_ORYNI
MRVTFDGSYETLSSTVKGEVNSRQTAPSLEAVTDPPVRHFRVQKAKRAASRSSNGDEVASRPSSRRSSTPRSSSPPLYDSISTCDLNPDLIFASISRGYSGELDLIRFGFALQIIPLVKALIKKYQEGEKKKGKGKAGHERKKPCLAPSFFCCSSGV